MGERLAARRWWFELEDMARRASCLIAALTVVAGCTAAMAQGGAGSDTKLFKLHASTATLGKTGIRDSVWRYFSDQGERAYLAKNYASAEKYYRAALQDAQEHKLRDANVAVLMTNLASTYREEGKSNDAESLYKQALNASEQFGTGPGSPYAYALKQYAALLARTGRSDEAQFALAAARNGSRLLRGSAAMPVAGGGPVPQPPLAAQAPFPDYSLRPPPPPMAARAQANDYPMSPLAGSATAAAPPVFQGNAGGDGDDRIIIDYTFLGFSPTPAGDQLSPQVYAHARTSITPSQVGSILRSLQLGPGLFGGQ